MKNILFLMTATLLLNAYSAENNAKKTFDYCCTCQESKFENKVKVALLVPLVGKALSCTANKYYAEIHPSVYKYDRMKDPAHKKVVEGFIDSSSKKMTAQKADFLERLIKPIYKITNKKTCLKIRSKYYQLSRSKEDIKSCENLFKLSLE